MRGPGELDKLKIIVTYCSGPESDAADTGRGETAEQGFNVNVMNAALKSGSMRVCRSRSDGTVVCFQAEKSCVLSDPINQGKITMKKLILLMALSILIVSAPATVFAENTARHGTITGKTVCFGLSSLLLWPGIGQYLNNNQTKKNVTHALIGLFPPFRLWSGWDALIARQGGRWDGKI